MIIGSNRLLTYGVYFKTADVSLKRIKFSVLKDAFFFKQFGMQ